VEKEERERVRFLKDSFIESDLYRTYLELVISWHFLDLRLSP
jgi:hypothetical protein